MGVYKSQNPTLTFGHGFSLLPMMAILGCQIDCIWNKLQPRNGGLTCEIYFAWLKWVNLLIVWTFEVKKSGPLVPILRWKDTLLMWPQLLLGSVRDTKEGSFQSLPAYPRLVNTSVPSLAL